MWHRGEESGVGGLRPPTGRGCCRNAQPPQTLHGVYPEPAEGFRETKTTLFHPSGCPDSASGRLALDDQLAALHDVERRLGLGVGIEGRAEPLVTGVCAFAVGHGDLVDIYRRDGHGTPRLQTMKRLLSVQRASSSRGGQGEGGLERRTVVQNTNVQPWTIWYSPTSISVMNQMSQTMVN